jgi:hypothetical protein
LEAAAVAVGAGHRVANVIDRTDEQHTKGLLGDGYFVSGSMNLTVRGVYINDEQVTLTIDEHEVAQARINFRDHYGAGPA